MAGGLIRKKEKGIDRILNPDLWSFRAAGYLSFRSRIILPYFQDEREPSLAHDMNHNNLSSNKVS